jgi:ankyrin repeat protein
VEPDTPTYEGEWVNVDSETRSITRAILRVEDGEIVVKLWGACSPEDCEWEENRAPFSGEPFALRYDQGFAIKDYNFSFEGSRLKLEAHVEYNDDRPTRDDVDFMRRAEEHELMGAKLPSTEPDPADSNSDSTSDVIAEAPTVQFYEMPEFEASAPISSHPTMINFPELEYTEQEEAIVRACELGNLARTAELLAEDSGLVNANAKTDNPWRLTPLSAAALNGHVELVILLLENGAETDPTIRDYGWVPPLHQAVAKGHTKAVQILIDAGADVNGFGYSESTQRPIHYAAWAGATEVIDLLLEAGVDIDSRDGSTGETALSVAVMSGQTELAAHLIGQGATVDIWGSHGRTPLHRASAGFFSPMERRTDSNREAMVALLRKHGANTQARNRDGQTPADLARDKGFDTVVALLENSEFNSLVPKNQGSLAATGSDFECWGTYIAPGGDWYLWGKGAESERLLISHSGGEQWREAVPPDTLDGRWIYDVVVSDVDPARILVGGGSRPLRVSLDGGGTWTEVSPSHASISADETEQIMAFFWDPSDASIAYLSTSSHIGKVNVDTGEISGLVNIGVYARDFTYEGDTIFLKLWGLTSEAHGFRAVRSEDNGKTWVDVNDTDSPWAYEVNLWQQVNDVLGDTSTDAAPEHLVNWFKRYGDRTIFWSVASEDGTIIAGIGPMKSGRASNNTAVLLSKDGGKSWKNAISGSGAELFDNAVFKKENDGEAFLDVRDLKRDKDRDQLLAIVDGTLYRRTMTGSGWEIVNPDVRTNSTIALADSTPPGPRILKFDDSAIVGRIRTRAWGETSHRAWENAGRAWGTVNVPEGKEVMLIVELPDLSTLKNLASDTIEQIMFRGSDFEDEQLMNLYGLTGLRSISLRGTRFSAAAMDALQRALPNCKVSR